mmetsp:Transcript_31429/g.50419  ORF Transcript_31429/g.50419 Transcript_31429/m.50419 type:complete len:88 (-) Transcript_31429:93-356(-)
METPADAFKCVLVCFLIVCLKRMLHQQCMRLNSISFLMPVALDRVCPSSSMFFQFLCESTQQAFIFAISCDFFDEYIKGLAETGALR